MHAEVSSRSAKADALTLRVEGLSVRLGEREVLREISFVASAPELIGIVGPNGSGKSTLLRALSGVLRPQTGRATWRDRELSSYQARERTQRIAHCRQEFQLSLPFKSRDVVGMGRHPYRAGTQWELAEDREIITAALARADAASFADRDVQQLSAGERQRVFLAKAFAQTPELLLADEPTSAQDIAQSFRVMQALKSYAATPSLVLVVLHDLALAARYCDKLLVLAGGRRVEFGSTPEILSGSSLEQAFGVTISAHPRADGAGWSLDYVPRERPYS